MEKAENFDIFVLLELYSLDACAFTARMTLFSYHGAYIASLCNPLTHGLPADYSGLKCTL